MANTTYATVPDLDSRLTPGRSGPTFTAAYKQDLLNAAAETWDGLTRGFRPGYEAFSASTAETRTYSDWGDGLLRIDDAVTVTAVAYNGTTLDAATWRGVYIGMRGRDYNRTPYTHLLIRNDSGAIRLPGVGSYGWGYAQAQEGIGLWTVTGIWGFCTVGTRPTIVKAQVCGMAKWAIEQDGVTPQQAMQAMRDPSSSFGRNLRQTLAAADLVRPQPLVVLYE